jgi:hypothetical protein
MGGDRLPAGVGGDDPGHRLGGRPVVTAGMALTMLGTLALTQVGAGMPYWLLAVALVIRGLGSGRR